MLHIKTVSLAGILAISLLFAANGLAMMGEGHGGGNGKRYHSETRDSYRTHDSSGSIHFQTRQGWHVEDDEWRNSGYTGSRKYRFDHYDGHFSDVDRLPSSERRMDTHILKSEDSPYRYHYH